MVIYRGPSQIDGEQIVAILTESDNVKVGRSLQAWIMRADVDPVKASHAGKDASVCGDCPQRRNLGGGCYVVVFQAALTVWRTWKRGVYTTPEHVRKIERALANGIFVRLGAYGDPAAVPFEVWADLLARTAGKWSAYTHQWRQEFAQDLREIAMASCDNDVDYAEARAAGWRAFVVRPSGERGAMPGAVECLADSRDMECRDCTACDGNRGNQNRTSIWIEAHGQVARRYHMPVVR